jgi:hypothetical protein
VGAGGGGGFCYVPDWRVRGALVRVLGTAGRFGVTSASIGLGRLGGGVGSWVSGLPGLAVSPSTGLARLVPFFASCGVIAAEAVSGGAVVGACADVACMGVVFARLGAVEVLLGGSWPGSCVGAFRLVPVPVPFF